MRITNNMIMGNTKTNINSTKVLVDKYNTQMTTQKKISKASEDPVIAIRSLRLSTSLSHLDQYKDNNIPDASSWMDVTQTALSNMKSLLTDIRTQCVNGSTDTLTADVRNTILQQLTALSEQVYTEGNADYAGRTVFTGYRTSSKLTFQKDTKSTYQITQEFSAADLSEKRYYTNGVTVPNSINAATPDCTTDVTEHSFQRIRLGYGNTTDDVKLSIDGKELTQGTDYTVYKSVSDFDYCIGVHMELDEQTKRDTALNKFVERIVRMYMTRSGKIMGNFSSKTSEGNIVLSVSGTDNTDQVIKTLESVLGK